ncbi:MAG: hypothetical protein KC621_27265 [Myxococcales bacterium]|nr:hypothetical protein [Myxococcales bacterium]
MVLWWTSVALAGSGPWTAGKDRVTVFVGAEGQRFGTLGTDSGADRALTDVGEGIQKLGIKGIATVGLGSRMELELLIPWYRVEATRPDAELCAALGLDACKTTQGVGIIETQLKALVLDEYFGAPLSLALSAELRLGQTTASTRERITNLGEGTIDVAPLLTIGRTGSLGKGYWSGWIEGGYRFRTRNTDEYPLLDPAVDVPAPRDEIVASTEILFGPTTSLAFGPTAYMLSRPGISFGEVDATDPDRFAALSVLAVRAGGTLVVRGTGPLTFAGSVLGTAAAINNPTDSWTASVGVQWDGRVGRDEDGT